MSKLKPIPDPKIIPNQVKLDIFNHIKKLPLKDFKCNMQFNGLFSYLNNQGPGEAVVFCHNHHKKNNIYINHEHDYYITPIICRYISAGRSKEIYLVEHPTGYIF